MRDRTDRTDIKVFAYLLAWTLLSPVLAVAAVYAAVYLFSAVVHAAHAFK